MGALAPEVTAELGFRWSEQFQLSAGDVHLHGCRKDSDPHVHIDAQLNNYRTAQDPTTWRVSPKGTSGGRCVGIPEHSITGYPLRQELENRCSAARAEQGAGRNPEALLFPALRGGLMWHTTFNNKVLLPAMADSGWPLQTWTEQPGKRRRKSGAAQDEPRTHLQADLTWHSLRHRFARTQVDLYETPEKELLRLGGWDDIRTVQVRYYRSGEENMKSGTRRMNNGLPTKQAHEGSGSDARAQLDSCLDVLTEDQIALLPGMAHAMVK